MKAVRATINCTFESNLYTRPEFISMKLRHTMCNAVKHLIAYYKSKQGNYNEIIHRLLTEGVRTDIPVF